MKAVIRKNYGTPDSLNIEEVQKPTAGDDDVLIKVYAVALNPLDWHYLRGMPYLMRAVSGFSKPKNPGLGGDFAGVVEAVGKNVTQFNPGDEVFGEKYGCLAEYISIKKDGPVVHKPAGITMVQAAALPIAAVTALQGLRDIADIKPGYKVLVNGASGGVGTFAVQIAKYYGAEVTGVCSLKNAELMHSLGADFVIDYTKEDFTKSGKKYDIILDNIRNHSLFEYKKILNPKGVFINISGGTVNDRRFFNPLITVLTPPLLSSFVSQKFRTFLVKMNSNDLKLLAGMMLSGKLKSVIDRQYKMSEIKEAMYYLETGHVKGKIIIVV